MTGQQLKNAILALAVQGKLVSQDPKDEPAAALLERVKAEKARLVKAGKIKKEKPLPPITDAEKPFVIPAGWEWRRIGNVFNLQAGKNITSSEIQAIQDELHPYPCYGGNGLRGYVSFFNRDGKYPLIGRQGALCGNINFAYNKFYATEHAVVTETFCDTSVKWAGLFLEALNLNQYATATAQPGLAVKTINQVLIPIPPLAEQKRIVKKIEELLPRVSAYDAAEQKLSRLDAEFPDKLKKSILQQAVQGKLAKQDKNDEPVSDLLKRIKAEKERLIAEGKIKKGKPLPPIAEEEKPFEIPAGWEWVRFANVMEFISTGPFGSVLHKNEYVHNGIPIVNPACIQHGKIIPVERMSVAASTKERLKMYVLHAGNIVIGRRGELGRCAIVGNMEDGWLCGTGCFFMNPFVELNRRFIQMVLASDYAKNYFMKSSVGTTMNNLNHQILKKFLFPLPPLAEQKRIVEQVEEHLALCDKLKSR